MEAEELESILAAILTIASMGSAGGPVERTMERYRQISERIAAPRHAAPPPPPAPPPAPPAAPAAA